MPKNPLPVAYSSVLSVSIRNLAPTTALVRVFPLPRAVTHFYGADFERVYVDPDVERPATRLIRQHFASVADWRRAHDFHVPTGRLYRTPGPVQIGYVPEDDKSFGMSFTRYVSAADGGAR